MLKTSGLLLASISYNVILHFYFKEWLCGEEHEFTTRSIFFFFKKDQVYKAKKNHSHKLFDNGANKNEAIIIFCFKSM